MSTRRSTRSVLVATLSLLACLVAPPALGAGEAVRRHDARQPEIVDLGIPGEYSVALRINDRGVIAGLAGPLGSHTDGYAFRWENGDVAQLPALGSITAMNLRGDVVGPSRSAPDGRDHGLVWHHDGTVTDLGPGTQAEAINRRGDVAGAFWPDPTSLRAAVWRDGVRVDLAPEGSIASIAEAINDSGRVLVNSLDSAGFWSAHLWDDGVLVSLPIRGGPRGAVGVGLNREGETVVYEAVSDGGAAGWFLWDGSSRLPEYRDPDGDLTTVPAGLNDRGDVFGRDFVWRDGTYTELGLPSRQDVCCSRGAFAMNRRGQLVGASPVDESTRRATLWDDGEVVDLGTLAGHRGSVAYDVNAWGDVVGATEDPLAATRAVRWTVRGR